MDIFEILEYLNKKYGKQGFKLMIREDTDTYVYLPSRDGDGWYLKEQYDTLAELIGRIRES